MYQETINNICAVLAYHFPNAVLNTMYAFSREREDEGCIDLYFDAIVQRNAAATVLHNHARINSHRVKHVTSWEGSNGNQAITLVFDLDPMDDSNLTN